MSLDGFVTLASFTRQERGFRKFASINIRVLRASPCATLGAKQAISGQCDNATSGYQNPQHFTRALRQFTGVTPTTYRRLLAGTGNLDRDVIDD